MREKHRFRPRGSREIADFRCRLRASLPEPPLKNPPLAGPYTTGVLRRNSILYDRVYYIVEKVRFFRLRRRVLRYTAARSRLRRRHLSFWAIGIGRTLKFSNDPVHYFARYTRASMNMMCARVCRLRCSVCNR